MTVSWKWADKQCKHTHTVCFLQRSPDSSEMMSVRWRSSSLCGNSRSATVFRCSMGCNETNKADLFSKMLQTWTSSFVLFQITFTWMSLFVESKCDWCRGLALCKPAICSRESFPDSRLRWPPEWLFCLCLWLQTPSDVCMAVRFFWILSNTRMFVEWLGVACAPHYLNIPLF